MAKRSFRNRIIGYDEVDPEQLLANPLNWRIHPKAQQEALEGVLSEVGWVDDIIVNQRTGFVVDGHLRVALSISNNEETIPVKYVDLDEEEERLVLATIDPIAAMASADKELLEDLLKGIQSDNEQVSQAISQIAGRERIDLSSDEEYTPPWDTAEELRKKYGVELGQVWQAGGHRLMCGDSTSADDIEKLMDGEEADFLFTSPPYNVGVDYGEHDDTTSEWDDYGGFLRAVMEPWINNLRDGRMIGWNIGVSKKTFHNQQHNLMEDLGLSFHRLMIWQKVGMPVPQWHIMSRNPVARRFTPNWTFELVMIFSKGKIKQGKRVGVDVMCANDVFQINQLESTREIPEGSSAVGASAGEDGGGLTHSQSAHPAPFPSRLPKMFIEHLCDYEAITVDPFVGSGATISAAHQINRRGYGMDIEPKYVAVALDRLEKMGIKPKRISK